MFVLSVYHPGLPRADQMIKFVEDLLGPLTIVHTRTEAIEYIAKHDVRDLMLSFGFDLNQSIHFINMHFVSLISKVCFSC